MTAASRNQAPCFVCRGCCHDKPDCGVWYHASGYVQNDREGTRDRDVPHPLVQAILAWRFHEALDTIGGIHSARDCHGYYLLNFPELK